MKRPPREDVFVSASDRFTVNRRRRPETEIRPLYGQIFSA